VDWKARTETAEEISYRLQRTLDGIYRFDPMFQNWRKSSSNETAAHLPFSQRPLVGPELTRIVQEGRYLEQSGGTQLERGFRVQAWDDLGNSKIVTLFVMAGDGDQHWPTYPNMVQISFSTNRTITEQDRFSALVRAWHSLILEWKPDRGYAYSYQFGTRSRRPSDPFPYLTGCWGACVKSADIAGVLLPQGAVTDVIDGYGTIVLATREPFNFESPEQVRIARDIQNKIEPIWSVGRNG
jgi:hypothetical protein